jgi:hypothetical protein
VEVKIMAKKNSEFIKNVKLTMPNSMEYFVPLSNDRDRDKFVKRVEKLVRSSLEYRDYIQFLKEHVGLDSCIFFQNVTNGGPKKSRVSVEIHHEPFTLYDIVSTVVTKYQEEGLPINDLTIADEVMKLHYENKVGLVPLSKTAHQIVHNSVKLMVPLNMCYGQYSLFLEEYGDYVSEDLYTKLEKKLEMTENLTPESFDAIKKEFTYLEVDGVEDLEKMELNNKVEIA